MYNNMTHHKRKISPKQNLLMSKHLINNDNYSFNTGKQHLISWNIIIKQFKLA